MSQLGVYFKQLQAKPSVDAANAVSFVIYDPVKDIDRRVGLTEVQSYLQSNLIFTQEGKQIYDLKATKTSSAYQSPHSGVTLYKEDDVYIVTPNTANTGPSTFQINSLPVLPLLKMSDSTVTQLEVGDLKNACVILYRVPILPATPYFLLFSSNGNEEKVLETITAGEDLVNGNLVYPSNDGKWYKADCLTEIKTDGNICYVTQSILTNQKGSAIRIGAVNTTGAHTLVSGNIYYVGINGGITNDVPANDQVFWKKIGTAITATLLDFNPSLDFVELTTVNDSVSAEFPDANADGTYYARKDNAWVNVEEIMLLNALMY